MGSIPAVLKLINNIEMIKRRAARWVKQDYRLTSSVSDMINNSQWITLQRRRMYSRLTIFYRFLHQDPPDIRIPHAVQQYLHHSISHFTCLSHQQCFIPPITSTNY